MVLIKTDPISIARAAGATAEELTDLQQVLSALETCGFFGELAEAIEFRAVEGASLFKTSIPLQERLNLLLAASSDRPLDATETKELDLLLDLDSIFSLLNAKLAVTQGRSRGSAR